MKHAELNIGFELREQATQEPTWTRAEMEYCLNSSAPIQLFNRVHRHIEHIAAACLQGMTQRELRDLYEIMDAPPDQNPLAETLCCYLRQLAGLRLLND